MTKCPLLPTGSLVALAPDSPTMQIGSIVLVRPDVITRGRVAAIGPEVEELAPGDYVEHKKYVVTYVEVGSARWALVKESDVLCKLA